MPDELLVTFATFPDLDTARRIVRTLVEERLIACGNLVPHVESIYSWKGALETSSEVIAMMKTTPARFAELQIRYRELHPYEVPELVAIASADALPAYAGWVTESVAK